MPERATENFMDYYKSKKNFKLVGDLKALTALANPYNTSQDIVMVACSIYSVKAMCNNLYKSQLELA